MAELKHTCANGDGLRDVGHAPEPCLRCDLTNLLKTVASSRRGTMNLGDGSELSRIEEALAEQEHLEYGARFLFGMLKRAETYGLLVPEGKAWLKAERSRKAAANG